MRLALIFAGGCAVAVPPVAADHPSSPKAPIGRLAGAPATLRPGVVDYQLPKPPPQQQQHHHHGS